MDTTSKRIESVSPRGRYRRHLPEFKRAVVEETLQPGASVARIARRHDLNANQVFAWRQAYRDGRLGDQKPALLPVEIVAATSAPMVTRALRSPSDGSLLIESARGRLQIEGRPDVATLRLVLEQLLR